MKSLTQIIIYSRAFHHDRLAPSSHYLLLDIKPDLRCIPRVDIYQLFLYQCTHSSWKNTPQPTELKPSQNARREMIISLNQHVQYTIHIFIWSGTFSQTLRKKSSSLTKQIWIRLATKASLSRSLNILLRACKYNNDDTFLLIS